MPFQQKGESLYSFGQFNFVQLVQFVQFALFTYVQYTIQLVYSHSHLLCTFVLSAGMFHNVPELTHLLSSYLLLVPFGALILQLLTKPTVKKSWRSSSSSSSNITQK
jgi:hypothetical protein